MMNFQKHAGFVVTAVLSFLIAGSSAVSLARSSGVAAVAAGYNHTVALKKDGTVWAWGDNSRGQIEGQAAENITVPVQVKRLAEVATIACGGVQTIALKKDGTLWVWGGTSNSVALGDESDCPCNVKNTPDAPAKSSLKRISELLDVIALAGGDVHNMALKKDGTVWAWGANNFGQLGNGTTSNSSTPVRVLGLSNVKAIAAGARCNHNLALKKDGTVWTWGWNKYGQLGDGTTADKSTPIQVAGLAKVIAVAGGANHSMALKSDGTVWAWGANYFGQLGDGTRGGQLKPIQVKGLTQVTAIASGATHAVALRKDGTVWTWGSNDFGQLGYKGEGRSTVTPVRVQGLTGVTAIACGAIHTLAIKKDGTVWAWGWNDRGEIGDGTTVNRFTPVQCKV